MKAIFGTIAALSALVLAAPAFADEHDCSRFGVDIPNDYGIPIAYISGDHIQEVHLGPARANADYDGAKDSVINAVTRQDEKHEDRNGRAQTPDKNPFVFQAYERGPCLTLNFGLRIPMDNFRTIQTRLTVNDAALNIRHGAGITIRNMDSGTRSGVPVSFKYELPREINEQMVYFTPDGWNASEGLNQIFKDGFESGDVTAWSSGESVRVKISPGTPHKIDINAIDWTALFMVVVDDGDYTGLSASRKLAIDGKDYPTPLYTKTLMIVPPGKVGFTDEDASEEEFCDITKAQIAAFAKLFETQAPDGLTDYFFKQLASEGHFSSCYSRVAGYQAPRTVRFGHKLQF